ncbi:hypothetical protein CR513_33389, partial [Mucuna pruriens]
MQSVGFRNIPSQTILNSKGGVSIVTLQSGKELPQQSVPQPRSRPVNAEFEPEADSQGSSRLESSQYHFPPEQSRQGEINIPLLDAIKQIPNYAKFLKELCMHKRKKLKGRVEMEGVMSMFIKSEDVIAGSQQLLPKKCRDLGIFSIPCTIGDCTFADVMLDLGASINVMSSSIYKSLNFGELEPTGMVIQLANRSVVQLLGILKDVLIQVNELIFPTDFYVLDMEDETSGKRSTLILGLPFFRNARTKIDIHVRILSMEFSDNLVQFNI